VTRAATLDDAVALVPLYESLGYPATAEQVAERLGVLLARDDSGVIVDDELRGVIAFHVMEVFTPEAPICRILALSVAPDAQRGGVASALVAAVEDEARRRGCRRMEVTSGARFERSGAHRFYESRGYVEWPKRFIKEL
jgi:GNAT superfamily N-acetyltransferase